MKMDMTMAFSDAEVGNIEELDQEELDRIHGGVIFEAVGLFAAGVGLGYAIGKDYYSRRRRRH